jgi:hypothetical protein
VRAETRLQANLVQNARNKAADAVQGVVARGSKATMRGNRTSQLRRSSTTSGAQHSTTTTRRSRPLKDASLSSTSCPTRAAKHHTRSTCSMTTTK